MVLISFALKDAVKAEKGILHRRLRYPMDDSYILYVLVFYEEKEAHLAKEKVRKEKKKAKRKPIRSKLSTRTQRRG